MTGADCDGGLTGWIELKDWGRFAQWISEI